MVKIGGGGGTPKRLRKYKYKIIGIDHTKAPKCDCEVPSDGDVLDLFEYSYGYRERSWKTYVGRYAVQGRTNYLVLCKRIETDAGKVAIPRKESFRISDFEAGILEYVCLDDAGMVYPPEEDLFGAFEGIL